MENKTQTKQSWSLLVDHEVQSPEGEFLGKIIEVIRDKTGSTIEYLVLGSKSLFGNGNRFFAIPALPTLINIDNRGKITLMAEKDELQFARGVRLEQCPKPDIIFNPPILELYEYVVPDER